MKGDRAVMYRILGDAEEAVAEGIEGCRRGRLEILAFAGRGGRFCLVLGLLLFVFACAAAAAGAVVVERCAILWNLGLKVLSGLAFVRGTLGCLGAVVGIACAWPHGGVSVMGMSCGCCEGASLRGFKSPLRVRFWPAIMNRQPLCVRVKNSGLWRREVVYVGCVCDTRRASNLFSYRLSSSYIPYIPSTCMSRAPRTINSSSDNNKLLLILDYFANISQTCRDK